MIRPEVQKLIDSLRNTPEKWLMFDDCLFFSKKTFNISIKFAQHGFVSTKCLVFRIDGFDLNSDEQTALNEAGDKVYRFKKEESQQYFLNIFNQL